ncbi:MAG TPA: hypothetical protein DCR70_03945 [Phycisphaerales bacterium]|nr:hypothetical protein [Phycisphaerales bacterium]
MKTRSIYILAVTALLAVIGWWSVRGRSDASADRSARASLFAADEIPLEQVDRIELTRSNEEPIVFVRTASGWIQQSPFAHPADPASIREVIDVSAALQTTRAIDPASIDPAARAALGLTPPAATLKLAWPGGERSVELGRRTVAGRAWAHVIGRAEAASIDASLHAIAVDGDPRQWRSTQLYEPGPADVGGIELRYGLAPSQHLTLARAAGKWRIESPVSTRADADAVRGYLEALARAQADAFVTDSPNDWSTFGLSAPERSVRLFAALPPDVIIGAIDVGVTAAEGAQERFGRIAERATVVQLGTKALAALFPPPAFFVDPRGSDVVQADVRAVTFTAFDPTGVSDAAAAAAPGAAPVPAFRLERTLDGWNITTPGADPRPASIERARKLLAQLCEARAPAVAFQRMPEALRIGEFTLFGAGGVQLARVRIAHEPEGQWAIDSDDGVLRVFPKGFDLAIDAAAYQVNR